MTGRIVVLVRGLPSSGKTTWSREWVAGGPHRAVVGRNEIRAMLFGKVDGLSRKQETVVSATQRAVVRELITAGWSVALDDVNLRHGRALGWADFAHGIGAGFQVVDITTSAAECIARDPHRAEIIHEIDKRYPQPWPDIMPKRRRPAHAAERGGMP